MSEMKNLGWKARQITCIFISAFTIQSCSLFHRNSSEQPQVPLPIPSPKFRLEAAPFISEVAFTKASEKVIAIAQGSMGQMGLDLKEEREKPVELFVWSLASGELEKALVQGSTQDFVSIALSPNGSFLAISSLDGNLRVLDIQSEKYIELNSDGLPFKRLLFSPGEEILVGYDSTGSVWGWEIQEAAEAYRLNDIPQDVKQILFSPDGATFGLVGSDGNSSIRDAQTGDLEVNLPGELMLFSPNGKKAAFREKYHHLDPIGVMDLQSRQREDYFSTAFLGDSEVSCFFFSPDSQFISCSKADFCFSVELSAIPPKFKYSDELYIENRGFASSVFKGCSGGIVDSSLNEAASLRSKSSITYKDGVPTGMIEVIEANDASESTLATIQYENFSLLLPVTFDSNEQYIAVKKLNIIDVWEIDSLGLLRK